MHFFKNLQRTSVWLRMVAITACPDVFQILNGDDDCKWPAASTFAYMYQGAEDYILEAMVSYCLQFHGSHRSLHYDGIRVDEGLVRETLQAIDGNLHDRDHYIQELNGKEHDRDHYLKALDKHVADRTGFNIRTHFKTHRIFIHTVVDYQTEVLGGLESGLFMEAGNCILLVLGRLINKSSDAACIVNALSDTASDPPRTRNYKDSAEVYDCVLVPTARPLLRGRRSQWLLHCEAGGKPHCVAIEVLDGDTCTNFHGMAKSQNPHQGH